MDSDVESNFDLQDESEAYSPEVVRMSLLIALVSAARGWICSELPLLYLNCRVSRN